MNEKKKNINDITATDIISHRTVVYITPEVEPKLSYIRMSLENVQAMCNE